LGSGLISSQILIYLKVFYIWPKTKTIENLFVYLAILAPFVPILFFFLNWKKTRLSKALWVIILYCFLIDFLVNFIIGELGHNPIKKSFYAAFTFFEYMSFAYFMFLQIKNKKFKKYMTYLSIFFCFFIIIYYLTVKFKTIDSIPIGIETILIIVFAFYYLYEEMNDTTTLFIYNKPSFWIILGIVLYLAGSFFIYIFAGYLKQEELDKYWQITNFFSILKHVFFCIAIYNHSKPSKGNLNYSEDVSSLN
jgi:hypothetical protein